MAAGFFFCPARGVSTYCASSISNPSWRGSFRPPNLDYHSIHSGYVMPERLAYTTCHGIARREGLFMGASTGAVVAAGIHLAHHMPKGSKICMMGPDSGDRYLETLYDQNWLDSHGFHLTDLDELEADILHSLTPVRDFQPS